MKKELQLVINLIENSIRYELGQVNFTIDNNTLTLFEKGHSCLYGTNLIGLISKIDKVNSYVDYDRELQKVVLRVF